MELYDPETLNQIVDGSLDAPPKGHILYLFMGDFVAASDSRDKLYKLGDLRVQCGLGNRYSIVPLDYVIDGAYFI